MRTLNEEWLSEIMFYKGEHVLSFDNKYGMVLIICAKTMYNYTGLLRNYLRKIFQHVQCQRLIIVRSK